MEHGSPTGGLRARWPVKASLVLGALALALTSFFFSVGDGAEPVCTGTSPFPYGVVVGTVLIAAWLAIVAGFALALGSLLAKGAHGLVPLAIVWLAADALALVAIMNALSQRWMSWCGG